MQNTDKNEPNYLQTLFYAFLKKRLPSWKEALEFASKNSIPENTMKDAYYKNGKVGVQVMNTILKNLLELNPTKLEQMINAIKKLEPISQSTQIWNSIDADESEKVRLAMYSKAIIEIENELKK